tara:strand:- start:209 stop:412 length:204 start_codon:yes stop_codon:yes gene_type:complete
MRTTENTPAADFFGACYNDNTIRELELAIAAPADVAECAEWGITEQEANDAMQDAIDWLTEDKGCKR